MPAKSAAPAYGVPRTGGAFADGTKLLAALYPFIMMK